ncbi:Uncharacterized protein TPAR_08057 [Tolypocladium paradoxum]|uniref:CBF1-interacting co-repressor CIR N-terminal domain-containing protein n=1 Tax=Tolypocladium paradoxum TaxID=94208 RepID=A0A2S4KNG6_9HYPO|nr:Uncharacterized protein TPAR_08057 [Tolypocladium paradoxum]
MKSSTPIVVHLLGKKSWNVYNADNIARVRRDEAAAKAAEEAEEQRMQEVDAQRRLAILRGEAPPPLEDTRDDEPARIEERAGSSRHDHHSGARRKRKRQGEDDTDFELRLAKERHEAPPRALEVAGKSTSSAPIVDRAGHIDLFGDERSRAHAEKNEEAEREAKKKQREYEDQYKIRLSNAAGRDGVSRPWYSQSDLAAVEAPSKNVWGKEDPGRKERDTQRMVANDPLAMMKKGAARVRELKQESKKKIGVGREIEGIDLVRLLGGRVGKGDDHETVTMTVGSIPMAAESIAVVAGSIASRGDVEMMDTRAGAILTPPIAGHDDMDTIND